MRIEDAAIPTFISMHPVTILVTVAITVPVTVTSVLVHDACIL